MTDPLDVTAVDVLGKRELCGVALRSPYGLPPRNAAAPPPTPRPGTRPTRSIEHHGLDKKHKLYGLKPTTVL